MHVWRQFDDSPTVPCPDCGHEIQLDELESEGCWRCEDRGAPELPASVIPPIYTEPRTIVLVACGAAKQPRGSAARDLYTSTWFKLARAYAETHGDQWFIMSAKHGLIKPYHWIKSYDKTLPASLQEREAWAIDVADLVEQWAHGSPAQTTVILLGGKRYRHPLTGWLRFKGYEVEQPLAGMGIGQQQAWLKANT